MNFIKFYHTTFIFLLFFHCQQVNVSSKEIAIGGFFTKHQLEQLLLFCIAVDELQFQFNDTAIIPLVHVVAPFNSYEISNKGKIIKFIQHFNTFVILITNLINMF